MNLPSILILLLMLNAPAPIQEPPPRMVQLEPTYAPSSVL